MAEKEERKKESRDSVLSAWFDDDDVIPAEYNTKLHPVERLQFWSFDCGVGWCTMTCSNSTC